MPCAGEGEFAGFAVLRDGAACGGGCAAADVHGGNQRVVGADEYVVADGGLVFVCAIVVAGDAAAFNPDNVTEDDRRFFPDALEKEGRTVHRNDPCPCGSGLKYKQCHGRLS